MKQAAQILDTSARKARMVDIAREARVSLATVDRVLNGRDGVNAETASRVQAVVQRLNYAPNLAASLLSRGRILQFDIVLPAGSNTFIRDLGEAVLAAERDFTAFGVKPRLHLIEGFDPDALAAALRRVGRGSDGVGVIALDHPAVREAVAELAAAGVPVATMVSDLPQSARIGYVGVDNRAAGRTAGDLMGRFLAGRVGEVGLIAGSLAYRGHEEREAGFRSVLRERFPNLTVPALVEGHDSVEQSAAVTARLLVAHPGLIGLYNIGGGNRGVAEVLRRRPAEAPHLVYIGHELTPHTRRFLIEGVMDAAINQNPRAEAAETLRLLLGHHIRPGPDEPAAPVRIEIFTRENLP